MSDLPMRNRSSRRTPITSTPSSSSDVPVRVPSRTSRRTNVLPSATTLPSTTLPAANLPPTTLPAANLPPTSSTMSTPYRTQSISGVIPSMATSQSSMRQQVSASLPLVPKRRPRMTVSSILNPTGTTGITEKEGKEEIKETEKEEEKVEKMKSLSESTTLLVLNLLEHPEDYEKFFLWNRNFSTRNRLFLLYQQRKRGYSVEPVGTFQFWKSSKNSVKRGEKALYVVTKSKTKNMKDYFTISPSEFSASQTANPVYDKNPTIDQEQLEPEEILFKLAGHDLPEDFFISSPASWVDWASELVEVTTGFQYQPYGDEIVTETESDLNVVGTIILLLSLFGPIWNYPILDVTKTGRNFTTLGKLRLRLINEIKNGNLSIPPEFLTNVDKILDLTVPRDSREP